MDRAILIKQALELTLVEKVHLIDALWRSLDPSDQHQIDTIWLEESQDRLDAFHAGYLHSQDGEEVLTKLRSSLQS